MKHQMKMKSMKLSKTESKAHSEGMEPEQPQYPWGLSLNLDNDALEKLDLSSLPAVGSRMMVHAMVTVTSVEEREHQGEKKKFRSISLQITDMALGPVDDKKPAAEMMYGG